jgi:AraC-like DNA-binding protein
MDSIRIREGFPNQHLFRLPRPILKRWVSHPLLQSLMPTDVGWFPHARYHYCARPQGAPELILIFCAAGEGWVQMENLSQPIYANEALLIPRDTPHVYGSSDHAPWSIHWAHLRGSNSSFYVNHVPREERKVLVERQCRNRIETLFEQSYAVLMEGFLLNRLVHAAQILQHLLGELFYNNPAFSPAQRSNRFRSIEPTLDFLRQNMGRQVSLAEMAAHAGLSVPHFSRLFKQQIGYAPKDFFIHLKVQRAISLLLLSQMTVREVALTVGYHDPYYFSRLFKKVVGMSPNTVRQEVHWQVGYDLMS